MLLEKPIYADITHGNCTKLTMCKCKDKHMYVMFQDDNYDQRAAAHTILSLYDLTNDEMKLDWRGDSSPL